MAHIAWEVSALRLDAQPIHLWRTPVHRLRSQTTLRRLHENKWSESSFGPSPEIQTILILSASGAIPIGMHCRLCERPRGECCPRPSVQLVHSVASRYGRNFDRSLLRTDALY